MQRQLVRVTSASLVTIFFSSHSTGGEPPTRRPFIDWTATRQEAPARDFDLKHVRLEVSIDRERSSLRGRTTQTFAPLRDDVTTLLLHAAELDVTSVTDGLGRQLAFDTTGSACRRC